MKRVIGYQEINKKRKGYVVNEIPETEKELQDNPPKQICVIDAKKFKPVIIYDLNDLEMVLDLCVTLRRKYKGKL